MKLTLATLSLASVALASQAFASNYPADYCHQTVRMKSEGPALFAHVGSGCDSLEVVGYRASGILAAQNPDFVDAVIVGSCGNATRTTSIRLGREWNGTGYMSEPLSYGGFLPQGCWAGEAQVNVAFSANGKWDSRMGQNYRLGSIGFYNESNVVEVRTGQVGYGSVNLAAWEAIINEMRRQ